MDFSPNWSTSQQTAEKWIANNNKNYSTTEQSEKNAIFYTSLWFYVLTTVFASCVTRQI